MVLEAGRELLISIQRLDDLRQPSNNYFRIQHDSISGDELLSMCHTPFYALNVLGQII